MSDGESGSEVDYPKNMTTDDIRTLDEERYQTLRDEVRSVRSGVRAQTQIFPEDTPARRFGELIDEKLEAALEAAENTDD